MGEEEGVEMGIVMQNVKKIVFKCSLVKKRSHEFERKKGHLQNG